MSVLGCDQQNNDRDCALFSIANASELALKGGPSTVRGVSTTAGAFRCIRFAVFVWTRKIGLVYMYLLSFFSANALTKIRGKTHSTSSRCAACKLN